MPRIGRRAESCIRLEKKHRQQEEVSRSRTDEENDGPFPQGPPLGRLPPSRKIKGREGGWTRDV